MNLLYFILGILFYNLILPLLQNFFEYINIYIESKKIKYNFIIAESNLDLENLVNKKNKPKNKIGFQKEEEEEEKEE